MIVLPWPSPALSPNARSRSHWPKTRAIKKARSDAFWAARAAKAGIAAGDVPVLLDVLCEPPTAHARDHDNMLASCKAYLDGIADALGVNDKLFRPTIRFGDKVKGGRVTVSVL